MLTALILVGLLIALWGWAESWTRRVKQARKSLAAYDRRRVGL